MNISKVQPQLRPSKIAHFSSDLLHLRQSVLRQVTKPLGEPPTIFVSAEASGFMTPIHTTPRGAFAYSLNSSYSLNSLYSFLPRARLRLGQCLMATNMMRS